MKETGNTARRGRRRLIAWLTFAALGIVMGAVWATGFASIGGATSGSSGGSPAVTSGGASDHVNALGSTVTANATPWTVTWNGRWGSTPASWFFKVDLDSLPAGQTFNVAMLLTNDISSFGWESLQLKVEQKDVGAGNSCNPATDFDGTQNAKVMVFDTRDAGVYWNALPGGSTYCIGLAAGNGEDTSGTFLRAAQDTPPTGYPAFTATVDRAS